MAFDALLMTVFASWAAAAFAMTATSAMAQIHALFICASVKV
jgi:hypothetical protein